MRNSQEFIQVIKNHVEFVYTEHNENTLMLFLEMEPIDFYQ